MAIPVDYYPRAGGWLEPRPWPVYEPVDLDSVRRNFQKHHTGVTRSLLVGLGDDGIEDILSLQEFLKTQGWDVGPDTSRLLIDNQDEEDHWAPDFRSIMDGLQWLTNRLKPGDTLFFGYSGRGRSLKHENGHLRDVLLTADGRAIDGEMLWHRLFRQIPKGANLICLIDTNHGGDVVHLPVRYKARGFQVIQQADSGRIPNGTYPELGQSVVFSGVGVSYTGSTEDLQRNLPRGACTNALLSVLFQGGSMSYGELILWMQQKLKQRPGFGQALQVACLRALDLDLPFSLYPDGRTLKPLPGSQELNPFLPLMEYEAARLPFDVPFASQAVF